MPVYVDDMYKYPMGRFGRMKMSHMIADTNEELHDMAKKIGVARRWCQKENLGKGYIHYDIAMNKRELAISFGAKSISLRELSAMCMEWRKI